MGENRQDEKRLLEEFAAFEKEREELRFALGEIGGQKFSRKDNWINIVFLVLIVVLVCLDLFSDILPWRISLEVGMFLVSFKIVFMIHSQQKVNHFQFWILNSIEYRMNEMSRIVRALEQKTKAEEQRKDA